MFEIFAMDFVSSPTSADNATVILWVVAVLMLGMAGLIAILNAKIKANEDKCNQDREKAEADRKECRDTASGHHKRIIEVYQTIIDDKEEASRNRAQLLTENANALRRNAEAFDRNTEVFNRLLNKGDL